MLLTGGILHMFKLYLTYLLAACSLLTCISCNKQDSTAKRSSILRISTEGDPQTLDPRRVRDLATTTTIHMLYEGLMRNGPDGKPAPALAENVAISPDQMTYTFTLRKSGWSDGTAVTAQDFEKSWKSMLAPEFPSPNAYQLYPIQGAQAAKEGRGSIDTVEVKAIDDATLVVNLEQPTPYFLSLLTTHFYYPVHETLRSQASDASSLSDSQIPTNGPFKLEKWHKHNELTAVPCSHYWDRSNVHLDQISLIVLDNPTALQLYQREEVLNGQDLPFQHFDRCLAFLKTKGIVDIKLLQQASFYFGSIRKNLRLHLPKCGKHLPWP